MLSLLFASTVVVYFLLDCAESACSSHDDENNCNALVDFGNKLDYSHWKNHDNWNSDKSICEWYGVTCKTENNINYVKEIQLPDNGLRGTIPDSVKYFSKMDTFDINGGKPSSYSGCTTTNLANSSLPSEFFGINALKYIDIEYSCLGGNLNGFTQFSNLEVLIVHGNYVSGTIPAAFNNQPTLQQLKLGRNPITGTVPAFTNLNQLIKFNCNFCSLSGQFPDSIFNLKVLKEAFWDGNGFTGTLPSTIGSNSALTSLSFNLNRLSGSIASGFCDHPPDETCTIGSDTDYSVYQANYPWIIKSPGNLYQCPLPSCLYPGANCDESNSHINCTSA